MSRPAVIITSGLWSGFDVAVDPPRSALPFHHFASRDDAIEWAELLAQQGGWSVRDESQPAGRKE